MMRGKEKRERVIINFKVPIPTFERGRKGSRDPTPSPPLSPILVNHNNQPRLALDTHNVSARASSSSTTTTPTAGSSPIPVPVQYNNPIYTNPHPSYYATGTSPPSSPVLSTFMNLSRTLSHRRNDTITQASVSPSASPVIPLRPLLLLPKSTFILLPNPLLSSSPNAVLSASPNPGLGMHSPDLSYLQSVPPPETIPSARAVPTAKKSPTRTSVLRS
ncbi:hypothetical protein CC2G_004914 [Coprinopsis cinerea AmutBmut pab1-1]|nr:hypothetical protein CC2G_004914 [Coprinopsis cinerea AmutBmut pab1-1]